MLDNVVLMCPAHGAISDPQTAQACTELLAETISLIDKQIERAEKLLGTDRAHLFLRAIKAHVAD
jgi:hypothetical protein